MNTRSNITANNEIVSEACAWVAQIESGDLSSADMAALREWIGRSPAHVQELREMAALSGQLAVLTELAEPLERASGSRNPLRKTARQWIFSAPALAASLALFVASAVIVSSLFFNANNTPDIYKTAVGEYQTVKLADGTSVSLNTDSQIEVDFNDQERRVRLIHGEALFEVASNPKRPFIVYSDTAVAEAVGTSFVVRLREAITELAVVEGVVAFSKLPASIDMLTNRNKKSADAASTAIPEVTEKVIVRAGQALTSNELNLEVEPTKIREIPVLTERDIQRKLSWKDGFLEFSETPLDEVIEELTRHNQVSIDIADDDLKDLKFGGIFRTGDVETLLDSLENLGVSVERVSDDQFLLRIAEDS